jgi:hypothetical protein
MKRAAVALVLLAACSPSDHHETLQRFAVPKSYHVTYSVSSGKARWIDELWVSRPFDSDNWTVGTSRVTAALGRQVVSNADATAGVLQVPPNVAPSDIRIDTVAAYALKRGLLQIRGSATYAGRKCQVYRSAKSLVARVMSAAPTARDHVDTCVDRDGLVLDERAVSDGKQTLAKRAKKVEVSSQHDFVVEGTEVPLDQGGGRVTSLTDDSRPPGESFWQLDAPPTGFTHLGRYAVVPPQPRVVGSLATSVDDVFTSGPDVIVVSNGHRPPVVEPGGRSVGVGRLYLSAVGSRIVIQHEHGAYVEVRGTVTPATLIRLARALVEHPPGTLVTVAP